MLSKTRMARTVLLFTVVPLAGLALAGAASAQAFPATAYSLESFPNGPNGSSPQFSNSAGSVGTSTNNIDGVASGAASASSQYVSAEVSAAGQNEGLAGASETYFFSVIGPQADVHLLINGGGYLYSTGGDGSVEVSENFSNIASYGRTCTGGSVLCGNFSYSQSGTIATNSVTSLHLGIFALVSNGSNGGWIDPMISIDPRFDDPSLFRFAFSDGITNGGVPEPASWALMITGFGLAGAAMRRRRSVVAA